MTTKTPKPQTLLEKIIWFALNRKLIVGLGLLMMITWGLMVSPFSWNMGLPRHPVAVDAIPDLGENQQIVFTKWEGRSPQDVEDQVTYPLTVALLGVPEVKTVRSFSMFGFSSIYVVFKEKVDFYWSRTRILEKLNALSPGTLPQGVRPTLGPDATALGQVFWYTLEGQDSHGQPTGGWDLEELRSIQDWQVKYALLSTDGVSEVASIGGFVKEYQLDIDPKKLKHFGITLQDVFMAVKMSNQDIGAKTIEVNRTEYVIRGIGFIKSIKDIENAVIKTNTHTPLYVKQVAHVQEGPALRRGVLNKEGTEAVGGVIIARYGANPLETIKRLKEKIKEIEPGLPKKHLADGRLSQLKIVPFYDRTQLINETLGTLKKALSEEMLITLVVVLLLIMNIRSSMMISAMLPLSVLLVFIAMKQGGVDANIVALSGIAIAIGTIVDMGIVMTENIYKRLEEAPPETPRLHVIYNAACEVGSAIFTAVATTIISFLPIFTMIGAEGKLFKPLAFTKTFALLASIGLALIVLPPLAHLLSSSPKQPKRYSRIIRWSLIGLATMLLIKHWMPLGESYNLILNGLAVLAKAGSILGLLYLFQRYYSSLLTWCLEHKKKALTFPCLIMLIGLLSWSQLGKEFMPSLDEGSFLYMPTTMSHASITETADVLEKQTLAFSQIPEVDSVVGKLGRVDSALDPAPLSMIETIINYKPEFGINKEGKRVRQWRDHIKTPDDIWLEIQDAGQIPGTTSAPKLQPIETRLIMLQSGIRAPMAIKIKGPDLQTIEAFGLKLEQLIKHSPLVEKSTVFADRVIGKPYIEIHIDREKIARYGIMLNTVQNELSMAIGGKVITHTIEGRERYPIRIRYQRELRDRLESLDDILINVGKGVQIPLSQLAHISYVKGPQVIKSEDTFLTSYVLFDKTAQAAEMETIENIQSLIQQHIQQGTLNVPNGVSFSFTGNYQNLIRSQNTLKVVLPLALLLIFMILYLHFNSIALTSLVFSGIFLAWAGGFIMVWITGTHLSIAVWVGFLALFGIASDNGVIMGTFLKDSFKKKEPSTISDIRQATLEAGARRLRPCLMTTATTLLALLPVLTSTGRGADIMIPMAIPTFGGMFVSILSLLMVPVIYSWIEENKL